MESSQRHPEALAEDGFVPAVVDMCGMLGWGVRSLGGMTHSSLVHVRVSHCGMPRCRGVSLSFYRILIFWRLPVTGVLVC